MREASRLTWPLMDFMDTVYVYRIVHAPVRRVASHSGTCRASHFFNYSKVHISWRQQGQGRAGRWAFCMHLFAINKVIQQQPIRA